MPTLPVVQYNQIKPAEYNAVQAKVAAVMGTPSSGVTLINSDGTTVTTDSTYGYNQTLASAQVSQYQTVTAKHIYDLRQDLLRARYHQLGPSNGTYQSNASPNVLPITYINTTATTVTPGGSVLLNSTTAGSNILTLNQSGGVYAGGPIIFSQTVGGLTSGTVYYIDQLLGNNQITLKTNATGTAISPVLTTATGLNVATTIYGTVRVGTTVGMTVGGGLIFSGTAFSSFVDGTTYYVLWVVDGTTIALSDTSALTSPKTLTVGTGSMNILGTGTLASRYKLIEFTDLNSYSAVADAAVTDRLAYDANQILPDSYNKIRDGSLSPWGGYNQGQSLTQTITIDFGTAAAATAYWNSGSYVTLYASMSSDSVSPSNTKNVTWNTMFANMGKLRIRRSSVDKSNTGAGVTLSSSLGWTNLTASHQQIVSIAPGASYTQNSYTVTAKRLGPSGAPTGLEIIIKYWDLSNFYSYYSSVSDYVGGQVINPGGSISTGLNKVDESVDGLLTSSYEINRSQGSNGVSIPSPTVTSTDLTIGDPLPTFTVTASAYTVNEGGTVRFNVTASNFVGSTVYYSIDSASTSVGNGFMNAADFTDNAASGSITLTSGSGFVDKTLSNDALTEGLETLYFRVRTVSATGLIVANCAPVTVSDSSLSPPPPPPSFPPPTGAPPSPTPQPGNGQLSATYVDLGLQQYGTAVQPGKSLSTNLRRGFAVQLDATIPAGLTTFNVLANKFDSFSIDTTYYSSSFKGNGNTGSSSDSTIYWLVNPPNYGNASATRAGAYLAGEIQVTLGRANFNGWNGPVIKFSNWYTSGPGQQWTTATNNT